MNALYALVFVFMLVLIPIVGVGAANLSYFFAVCIPYTAVTIFVLGFAWKIFKWAKSPVPFRIPTTAGQQQSLDWISQNKWDNPSTGMQTVVRMIGEVFLFRSLFRNTRAELRENNGPVVAYASSKWLWIFAILFHYGFVIIFFRHFRLFLDPVPVLLDWLEFGDGILQLGVPRIYQSDLLILVGLSFLFGRRLWDAKVRYISLVQDYFPLLLILGVVLSGIYMRYFVKVDIVAIKALTMGLVTFALPAKDAIAALDLTFFIHLFLVSSLMIYFPFSKLMHLGGVFMSPTRNMPNDTRIRHHVNPWNPTEIKAHAYADYEKEFGAHMAEAGLPLDDPANAGEAEAPAEEA
jgi:nitrate reductase gamma subunit